MTSIETQPRSSFALDITPQPVVQPPALAPAPTQQPSIWNREVATHAFLGVAQVGAIGGLAYLATSSVTLVAAALAGAVATGIAIAKAVGSRSSTSQVAAALDADRRALNATRDLLVQQSSAIASDRGKLDSELAHVQSERQHLSSERENIAQRVAFEANKIIATEKEALATERAQLEERMASFEARVQNSSTPLQAEAAALTTEDIAAIKAAANAYAYNSTYRFAPKAYSSGPIVHEERVISPDHVLATLVGGGMIAAGVCHEYASGVIVPRATATVITSIHQLRTHLRLATGHSV